MACGRVPGWNCADSTEFRQLNFGECPEVEVPADWKTLDIFWVNSGVPVSWRMLMELRRMHCTAFSSWWRHACGQEGLTQMSSVVRHVKGRWHFKTRRRG